MSDNLIYNHNMVSDMFASGYLVGRCCISLNTYTHIPEAYMHAEYKETNRRVYKPKYYILIILNISVRKLVSLLISKI